MIIFGVVIAIWALCGVCGLAFCKDLKINWPIIVFMLFVPFLPLIAKVCGM